MAIDLATLALKVEALEVENASRKLDDLTEAGGRTEKAASGLSKAFTALGVALAAAKLGDMVRDAAMAYSRYETLGAAMNTVGNNAGYTALQMAAYEKALRSTGIAMTESRETLTKMAASHIDLAHATDLARVAQDAAVIGNINSSEAFDRMINGIRSAEVEVLRGIGLNVNFEQSYAKLAAQLGKYAKDLTETEKTQARVNAVMGAGAGIAGTYEAAMDSWGKMIKSMTRYVEDLKVSIGAAFGPAVEFLVRQMTDALKNANKEVQDGQSIIDAWGIKFRSAVISIEAELIRLSMFIDKVGGTMTAVLTGAGELIDVARNVKGAVSDMYSGVDSGWSESELTKLGKKWNKVYEDRYQAGDKALTDLAELEMKLTNEVKKGSDAEEQARIKAGLAARSQQELDDKRAASAKEAEAAAKKARAEAERNAKAHEGELQRLIDQYLPLSGAAETAAAAEKGLIELRDRGAISAGDYALAMQHVREELYGEQEAATHAMERQTQMAESYRTVNIALMTDSERAVSEIADKYAILNAKVDGVVATEPKLQQWGATAHAALGQKMADEIQKTADNAGQMGKMFEDVAKNIQSAFSRMFEDMLDGTGNMMDSIESMFKRLLAQMATMAIANPIILPIVVVIGSALGLSSSAIASATGTSTTQISGLGGISSLFSSGSLQGMGVSALAGIGGFAQNIGLVSVGNIAMEAGTWLNGLSSGLADGLMGGVGSLAMSLLSGQGLSASTGLQAAGSVLGGFLGGGVGAVIGGLVGDLVSGLFGTGEDTFGPQYMANDVGVNYDRTAGMVPTTKQYTGGDTDSKIAKVYAEQMRSIQSAFDDQVTALAEALPEELSNAMLDNLASADLKKILKDVSGQEINVKDAESWLEGVAVSYSEGLISALGTAFGSALSDFIDAKGAAGLVGDNAAWSMLTDAVQENIESAFKDAADTIAGGDITSGMTAINNVTSAIAAINSAMAPISEIIDTNGMSEYEKSLRSINNQFDTYRDALKAAGVDMEKYTDLEKARSIQLIAAADDYFAAVNGQFTDALEKLNPTANIASATSQLSSLLSQAESGDFSGIDSLDSIASTLAGQDMGSYASLLDYQRSLWSSYNTVAEIERLAKANAPKFAAGGDHAGGWRTVGENGPELEYTGPSQIVSNGKASALVDNTEVVSAIKTMQNRLERMLFAVAKNSGQTTEQLKRWEYNGMPEVREAI